MGGKSTNVVPLLPTGISRLGRKIKVLVEISFSRLVLFASRPSFFGDYFAVTVYARLSKPTVER